MDNPSSTINQVPRDGNPNLFDPTINMSGIESFVIDNSTCHDLLISLSKIEVDRLYIGDMQIFDNSSHSTSIPPIPPNTLRVWIYEKEYEAVTTIAAFRNSHVIRIYTLTNPCTRRVLYDEYGFDIATLPNIAPSGLCRDYHRFAQRI